MEVTLRQPTIEELARLLDIVRRTARGARLSREDAEDFEQSVHLRLIEHQYDIFGKFDGRSSLSTYLSVVVRRMLLDWRNSLRGKWRPSMAAIRLGRDAVRLERRIVRDGLTVREAIETMRTEGGPACDLERLAQQLPLRMPRRVVPLAALDECPSSDHEPPLEANERRLEELQQRRALAAALRQLPPEDRHLIKARYKHGCSVRAVAASLSTDPKRLYRRFDQLLQRLRNNVAAAG